MGCAFIISFVLFWLVQLRNPWGRCEWRGAWSDGWAGWTKRLRQKLGYNPTASTDDDGIFWMSFDDFVLNFRNVYVCRLFKTVSDGGQWFKYTAAGSWSTAANTAGGCPNESSCANNPHYFIVVEARCTVFVTLAQREREGELDPIGFKLLRKKGKRVRSVYQGEQVMGGAYSGTREVRCACSVVSKPRFNHYLRLFRCPTKRYWSLTRTLCLCPCLRLAARTRSLLQCSPTSLLDPWMRAASCGKSHETCPLLEKKLNVSSWLGPGEYCKLRKNFTRKSE